MSKTSEKQLFKMHVLKLWTFKEHTVYYGSTGRRNIRRWGRQLNFYGCNKPKKN